ncbi:exodeoxyribonuclease VII large subunit [Moraxella nasibovis]|uniref:exodeoxyribonuclease VII large subunit n=1 Tax=Moraxella nasibovis TaxID=2904120 RepID=UPI00240F322C|nr:exodeoxyribonuclease VII large subunit [Moraxella nasibovis]WFF39495.1 exodeoxyribonuclease VII large subunit [Moraxella nasibovis]
MNPTAKRIADLAQTLYTPDDKVDELHAKILAEMDELSDQMDTQSTLQGAELSLSDYLTAVKMVISDTFDHEVWVRAEVRALSSKGGHYYFELAEKDDNDQIVASCRGTLWRYKAPSILAKFHTATGRELQAGTSILIKAAASFHAQYGFSINISDIDPTYTLGELAAAYHAMLKRLHDEGLTTLNKALPTPFDIRHVIVIAPESAAGLGDFRREADRLEQAGACTFHYHHATFQGNHAPDEIRGAITKSMAEFAKRFLHLPDLMVIIRGGGAVGDLAYLNDFELAALIAEQPIPVWVGIGHERDRVLLDEVAHTRFDTPSKVIAAIERQLITITQNAKDAMQHIQMSSQAKLTFAKNTSDHAMKQSQAAALKLVQLAKKDSQNLMSTTKILAKHQLDQQKTHNAHLISQSQTHATAKLSHAKSKTANLFSRHKVAKTKLVLMREHCKHLQSLILIQHPAKTLAKGYALVYQDGKIISSAHDAKPEHDICIKFHDGSVQGSIHGKTSNKNEQLDNQDK